MLLELRSKPLAPFRANNIADKVKVHLAAEVVPPPVQLAVQHCTVLLPVVVVGLALPPEDVAHCLPADPVPRVPVSLQQLTNQ